MTYRFKPDTLAELLLSNRIVMAPMDASMPDTTLIVAAS